MTSAGLLGTLLFLSSGACSSSEPAPAAQTGACPGTEIVTAASDYGSSLICGAPPCEGGQSATSAAFGGDVQLTDSRGRVFFMARRDDLLFEIDPGCGVPIVQASVKQAGVTGANAHDVAVAKDGSLWVALYNVPRLVHLVKGPDGQYAQVDADTIELSSFDPDGNPQAESIRIVDVGGVEKAFVALERLDDLGQGLDYLRSRQASWMLRIDLASHTVETHIELAGRNPFNPMVEHEGGLFLAESGNFDDAAEPLAGIERFDVATGTTKLLAPETSLGGSVLQLAVTDGCGAALVAGPQPNVNPTSLVTFDPVTGQALTTTAAPVFGPTAGYDLQGLTWRGDLLYVGDRRRAGIGYPVRIFARDPGTCILHDTGRTIPLPMPAVTFRAVP